MKAEVRKDSDNPAGATLGTARDATPRKARTVCSAELLGGAGMLMIEHQGEIYCLRQTRRGRLILTK